MNLQRLATIIIRLVQPEIARAVMRKLSLFNAEVLVKRTRFFSRVQYWAMQVAEFVVGSNQVQKELSLRSVGRLLLRHSHAKSFLHFPGGFCTAAHARAESFFETRKVSFQL